MTTRSTCRPVAIPRRCPESQTTPYCSMGYQKAAVYKRSIKQADALCPAPLPARKPLPRGAKNIETRAWTGPADDPTVTDAILRVCADTIEILQQGQTD